jgi:pyruvate dehydrogenase E2 component (dihydrolipoamide acetyltransferase)
MYAYFDLTIFCTFPTQAVMAGTAPALPKAAAPAATPTAPTPSPAAVAVAPTPSPAHLTAPIDVVVDSTPVNSNYEDVPNNNMRKIIAKRLTESKATVPHFYTTMQVHMLYCCIH